MTVAPDEPTAAPGPQDPDDVPELPEDPVDPDQVQPDVVPSSGGTT